MMNMCCIVGTVLEKPVITKGENGSGNCSMYVVSDRPFRNEDGSLDEDIFYVRVWRGIAEEVEHLCEPGTIVAVKGRIHSRLKNKDDHGTMCEIIAESVSYPHRRSVISKK